MKNTIIEYCRNRLPIDILIFLFLIISSIIAYWQVQHNDFVNFDDNLYVYENKFIQQGLTHESIKWAFNFSENEETYWHPLTWLSHMMDCEFYGLNPGYHHLTSLLFHISNAILLFIILNSMTGARWSSAMTAAVFALHPLNVDSVAWIAERKNVLSTFFLLLTLCAYIHYSRKPQIGRYSLVIALFILGLLAKPMIVTLPFALLLIDYWPLARFKNKIFWPSSQFINNRNILSPPKSIKWLFFEKIPMVILAFGTIFWVSWSIKISSSANFDQNIPYFFRFSNALISYLRYIGKIFFPVNLSVFYPFPMKIPIWQITAAITVLSLTTIVIIICYKRFPFLAVGWFWFVGTLVPVSGIVQAGLWPAMADRWAYVPAIGIFIIIAWGISHLVSPLSWRNFILAITSIAIIAPLMILSWFQVRHWQTTLTLFEHALKVDNNNYLAQLEVGNILAEENNIEKAIEHFHESVRANPLYYKAQNNLALGFLRQNRVDDSIYYFKQALKLKPDYVKAHNGLGIALMKKKKVGDAILHFEECLRLNPNHYESKRNLEGAIAEKQKNQMAAQKIIAALKYNPNDSKLYYELGSYLEMNGRLDDAMVQYHKAHTLKPTKIVYLYKLSLGFAEKGSYEEAIESLKQVIELRPNLNSAYYNIACLYAKQNKTEDAIEWLSNAVELGYDKWDKIKKDEDLISIRNSDFFKELMKGVG